MNTLGRGDTVKPRTKLNGGGQARSRTRDHTVRLRTQRPIFHRMEPVLLERRLFAGHLVVTGGLSRASVD
jgi:hypothetical protein